MYGLVAREIVKNVLMGIPAVRRLRLRRARTTDLDPVLARSQFEFFAGTIGEMRGKTIVEIGPGDKLALAPYFLEAGVERYVAFDRFMSAQNKACDRIELHEMAVEDSPLAGYADAVVSFATLEHLSDLPRALRAMNRMLKPGGVMVHRVDYGPHHPWGEGDDLSFLSLSSTLWRLMGSNRGYPNRMRHGEVRAILQSLGLQLTERVRRTARDGSELDVEFACALGYRPQLGPVSKP